MHPHQLHQYALNCSGSRHINIAPHGQNSLFQLPEVACWGRTSPKLSEKSRKFSTTFKTVHRRLMKCLCNSFKYIYVHLKWLIFGWTVYFEWLYNVCFNKSEATAIYCKNTITEWSRREKTGAEQNSRQPCPTVFFLPIWNIHGCYGNTVSWITVFYFLFQGPKAAVYKAVLCTVPITVWIVSLEIC